MALEHDLEIIPVLNKIDLPSAEPEVARMITKLILCEKDIIPASAKTGVGIDAILSAIVEKIPPQRAYRLCKL